MAFQTPVLMLDFVATFQLVNQSLRTWLATMNLHQTLLFANHPKVFTHQYFQAQTLDFSFSSSDCVSDFATST